MFRCDRGMLPPAYGLMFFSVMCSRFTHITLEIPHRIAESLPAKDLRQFSIRFLGVSIW